MGANRDEYLRWGDEGSDSVASLCIIAPGYEGAHYYEPIDFCPFCGERLVYVEVARVRRVERKVTETKTVERVEYDEVSEEPKGEKSCA